MSHPEQIAFFRHVAASNTGVIRGSRVLEIGAHDVNGTVRKLFTAALEYVGVDLAPGPGVDVVAYGHEVEGLNGSYDVALSAECFEHDPHWGKTFANMVRLTRGGGLVAFTCASRGRPEHGTRRTDPGESPGTQAQGHDYYRNLSEEDFAGFPLDDWFTEWAFWYLPTSFDLYFAGVRRGAQGDHPRGKLPSASSVTQIARLMPTPHRLARAPLRVALAILPEDRYQAAIRPYWQLLRRAGKSYIRSNNSPTS